jgi:type IV pilus assembly protein PilV
MKTPQSLHIGASRMDRRRGAAGFALVEVLVAVLLFTIGILGLVGLQATMTQTQTESKVRADAANLVDELATVMWGELGNQNTLTNLAGFSTSGCAGNAACNAWLTKLAKALPGGALSHLELNAAADTLHLDHGKVEVTVEWSLPNGGTHKYVSTFNVAQNVFTP